MQKSKHFPANFRVNLEIQNFVEMHSVVSDVRSYWYVYICSNSSLFDPDLRKLNIHFVRPSSPFFTFHKNNSKQNVYGSWMFIETTFQFSTLSGTSIAFNWNFARPQCRIIHVTELESKIVRNICNGPWCSWSGIYQSKQSHGNYDTIKKLEF